MGGRAGGGSAATKSVSLAGDAGVKILRPSAVGEVFFTSGFAPNPRTIFDVEAISLAESTLSFKTVMNIFPLGGSILWGGVLVGDKLSFLLWTSSLPGAVGCCWRMDKRALGPYKVGSI